MKKFENPELEVISMQAEDVITTSSDSSENETPTVPEMPG